MFIRRIFLLWVLILSSSPIMAQWRTTGFTIPNYSHNLILGDIITYSSGKLWAGSGQELWVSADDGVNWTRCGLTLQPNEHISDLSFFDANNGVVCALSRKLYTTSDGGVTWRVLRTFTGLCNTTKYIGSSKEIVVATSSTNPNSKDNLIGVTTDGGATWKDFTNLFSYYAINNIQTTPAGDIFGLGAGFPNSEMLYSNDYGATWRVTGASFDGDCYSFALDPCDVNTIYIMNEEFVTNNDNITDCIVSKDRGVTWKKNPIGPFFKFSTGSIIAPARSLLYMHRVDSGVMRSTDGGAKWINISGPNGVSDSRTITSKGNDSLFVMDENGEIWFSPNSGGVPYPPLPKNGVTLSQNSLFSTDSLFLCDSIKLSVHLLTGGCVFSNIISEQIIGSAAGDYTITTHSSSGLSGDDSLIINFLPSAIGLRPATYQVTLDNGTVLSLSLLGFGKPQIPLALKSPSLVIEDTIGGETIVPVTVIGLDQPQSVEMTITYNTRNLVYQGSTSIGGTSLDLLPIINTGFAKIRIPANDLRLDTVSAFAHFFVYADTVNLSSVLFDSLRVLDPLLGCRYVVASNGASASLTNIADPSGCGVVTISDFLRYHKVPGFSIVPNPSTGPFMISTNMSLGTVSISVSDALGSIRKTETAQLSHIRSAHIDLSGFPSGVYYVRIMTNELSTTLPIIIQK